MYIRLFKLIAQIHPYNMGITSYYSDEMIILIEQKVVTKYNLC